jgi:hypothetical protein
MKKAVLLIFISILLLSGCRPSTEPEQGSDPANSHLTSEPADPGDLATPESIPGAQETRTEEEIQQDIDACYANPNHPIGQQIAAQYPEFDYTKIMDWFCGGFEFEDILTALQTAEISEFHPEILLTMLEYGQSWEQIWAEIGLD